MGAGHQVLVFDDQVVDRDHRQVGLQALPAGAVVQGNVDAALRAHVEQAGAHRIFANHAGDFVCGESAADIFPAPAVVFSGEEVGAVVVQLDAGSGHPGAAGRVRRERDFADQGKLGQLWRGDLLPGLGPVPGDVDKAVVAAGPEHPRFVRRLGKGIDCAIAFGAGVVVGDGAARKTEGVRVVAAQVRTDGLPAVALVVRAEDMVAGGVEHP